MARFIDPIPFLSVHQRHSFRQREISFVCLRKMLHEVIAVAAKTQKTLKVKFNFYLNGISDRIVKARNAALIPETREEWGWKREKFDGFDDRKPFGLARTLVFFLSNSLWAINFSLHSLSAWLASLLLESLIDHDDSITFYCVFRPSEHCTILSSERLLWGKCSFESRLMATRSIEIDVIEYSWLNGWNCRLKTDSTDWESSRCFTLEEVSNLWLSNKVSALTFLSSLRRRQAR